MTGGADWYSEIPAGSDGVSSASGGTGRPPRRGPSRWWGLVLVAVAVLVVVAVVVRPASPSSGTAPDRSSTDGTVPAAPSSFVASGSPSPAGVVPDPAPPTGSPSPPGPSSALAPTTFRACGSSNGDCSCPPIVPTAELCESGSLVPDTIPTSSSLPAPSRSSGAVQGLARESDWRLQLLGPGQLTEIDPATGDEVVTPLSWVDPDSDQYDPTALVGARVIGGPTATVAWFGANAIGLFGQGAPPGFLIRPGQSATPLAGGYASAAEVLAGPADDTVWAESVDGKQFRVLDLAGHTVGTPIAVPPAAQNPLGTQAFASGVGPVSDGRGGVLLVGTGGTFDLGLTGVHRISPSSGLVASGRAGTLLAVCGAAGTCQLQLVAPNGASRTIPGNHSQAPCGSGLAGSISVDGQWALACQISSAAGPQYVLLNLVSGAVSPMPPIAAQPGWTVAQFSPDGDYVLCSYQQTAVQVYATSTGQLAALWLLHNWGSINVAADGM